MAKGVVIREIIEGSLASEAGIKSGDRLVSINGQIIRDIIDIEFYQADPEVLISWENPEGTKHTLMVEKDPDENLGIIVDPPPIKRCPNKCDFCFVDQMPEGQRKTLYIRDEDYRYSFLYGNFITLTNLSEKDFERVVEQKLSPLYISVHATDPDIRKELLRNEHAPFILDMVDRLLAGGIRLNTQIVLMPGINDGAILEKSVRDLSSRYPGVSSLAIVPVGLTSHRVGLPSVRSIDRRYARNALKRIQELQRDFEDRIGDPFLYPADEWYVLAEKKFPSISRYGSLPQIGNGVGMVPLFESEWKKWLRKLKGQMHPHKNESWVLVTGEAFYSVLLNLVRLLEERVPEWKGVFNVCKIENHLFGYSVTVAGLLTAKDISSGVQAYLSDRDPYAPAVAGILIPDVVLRADTEILLDDGSLNEIRKSVNVPVYSVPSDARGFWEWFLEERSHMVNDWQPLVMSL